MILKIEAVIDTRNHNYSSKAIRDALIEAALSCGYDARLVGFLVQEMRETYD